MAFRALRERVEACTHKLRTLSKLLSWWDSLGGVEQSSIANINKLVNMGELHSLVYDTLTCKGCIAMKQNWDVLSIIFFSVACKKLLRTHLTKDNRVDSLEMTWVCN